MRHSAILAALLGLAAAPGAAQDTAWRVIAGADPARGRALVLDRGCRACHVIPGVPGPYGRVGPSLAGLEQRAYIAGQFPNRPGPLVRWLVDPPFLAPETAMPALGLTEQNARDIAAYLYGAASARPAAAR